MKNIDEDDFKIHITKEQVKSLILNKRKCPNCNEERDYFNCVNDYYTGKTDNVNQGIYEFEYLNVFVKPQFFQRGKFFTPGFHARLIKYKCYSCGYSWLSDPVKIEKVTEGFV